MSYIVIRIYSFECDYPGCEQVEEHGGPFIADGLRGLRSGGWTITRDRKHYCPKHKPAEEA